MLAYSLKAGTHYPCSRPVFTGVKNVNREHGYYQVRAVLKTLRDNTFSNTAREHI